ncbi:MAG: BNR repeat-containing protein [Armatimonadota bacterium]|nr:BNR repeat-containing protein [Armatimonadota bacterium]
MRAIVLPISVVLAASSGGDTPTHQGGRAFLKAVKSVVVGNVWSGAPVGFCIATRGNKQYVAYYDADCRMTIACRSLDSDTWTYQKLEDRVGWDSHNGITFAFDCDGCIHLAGNMHGSPLRYYRTTKPEDITTFVRVESMVGANEQRCTYPRFGTTPNGALTFSYRDGGSGNGNEIVNVYDAAAKKWTRLLDKPLFDGEGKRNAYYTGPVRDQHGIYHLAWVWRESPDCSTNHDVSYARSPDYKSRFEKSDGTPIPLPITLANAEVIDPVPTKGGLLNNIALSLDSQDRPMVTYIKFDEVGRTQIYTARREQSGWRIYRTTDWKDRWEFSGGGSIPTMISFTGPQVWNSGRLCQVFTNKFLSPHQQVRFLDEATLKQIGEPVPLLPEELVTPRARHTQDWQVNIVGVNFGALRKNGRMWVLRWESAGANRDRPRDTVPPPSRLEVIELTTADSPG